MIENDKMGKELEKFDFVFFMNANMEVVSLVSKDILFGRNQGLINLS